MKTLVRINYIVPLYARFKQQIDFPENYLNKFYNSKFIKHFYTEKEIKNFVSKWNTDKKTNIKKIDKLKLFNSIENIQSNHKFVKINRAYFRLNQNPFCSCPLFVFV